VKITVKQLAERVDDEGELTVTVTQDSSGQILIDFGKPVHWLAMPREQAQEFALNILRKSANRMVRIDLDTD